MHLIDQQLNLMIRGRFDDAWKISEQLEKETPDDPRAIFNRGWHLIHRGDFQNGFKCLEYGRLLDVYGNGRINTTKPIWDQSDLNGKTVLINLEAGCGDNIIYARFATEVWKRGGKCILCCDKSLHSLFMRIPGVNSCITTDQIPSTDHDFWIPGFSCSWLFGHDKDTIPNKPYIFPMDNSVDIWEKLLNTDKKYKVGIRWSGNPQFEHQQFRIFPPKKLINLHKDFDNIQFYSLQVHSDLIDLPDGVVDLRHLLISWEDTASCIDNLDLVITSCTSIAHLASAMGKQTWVIVPILPYHIWAYGEHHSPWYQKTTKIFRQEVFGDWEDPFDSIKKELKEKFMD
jgi:hypothetical protein